MMDIDFEQLDGEIIIYESIDLRDLDYVVDRSMERVPIVKSWSKSKSRSSKKSHNSNKSRAYSKTPTNVYSRRNKTA